MLCEECGEQEATFTVSVLMGEERTTRHLCQSCVAKMNAGIAAGNIRALLSSLMSAISGNQDSDENTEEQADEAEDGPDPAAQVVCERCGTTLAQFRKSGRLGCTGCYQAFRSQLQPMLQQIHGKTQHAGRQPISAPEEQRVRSRREQLTRLMAQAVAA